MNIEKHIIFAASKQTINLKNKLLYVVKPKWTFC